MDCKVDDLATEIVVLILRRLSCELVIEYLSSNDTLYLPGPDVISLSFATVVLERSASLISVLSS